MRSRWCTVLLCLLACPLPAWANNPPQPDGMLGIVLIFPAVILGLRLAGASLPEISRRRKILERFVLGVAAFLTAGGTGIALIPLVILLVYGIYRGLQVMRYGQGGKRFAVGGIVILFAPFAVANYIASLSNYPSGAEARGTSTMRLINTAEQAFKAAAVLDGNKNGVGEYGTLEQLEQQGLLPPIVPRGYKFVLVLGGDPSSDERQYFLYATPSDYGKPHFAISLLAALRPSRPYARRTLATDETGTIRARDLGGARPVSRAEVQKWEQL